MLESEQLENIGQLAVAFSMLDDGVTDALLSLIRCEDYEAGRIVLGTGSFGLRTDRLKSLITYFTEQHRLRDDDEAVLKSNSWTQRLALGLDTDPATLKALAVQAGRARSSSCVECTQVHKAG